ncbi:alpha/beta fold hydrolase [Spirosoma litoris]
MASSTWASNTNSLVDSTHVAIKTDSLKLFDTLRSRLIPVFLYMPRTVNAPLKLAVLSHGYEGSNKAYSFIAQNLVAHGYLVASIQHELPTDEPLPMTGRPYEVRMPNWQRGSENIHFVIEALQKQRPDLDAKHVLLIGHSNGGDMTVLFAQQHPTLVSQVISLDNRRMPLPRVRSPRILSIRSSDQVADQGVLPTEEEQRALGIQIVQLPATLHNDMWDGATQRQKQEINRIISAFID